VIEASTLDNFAAIVLKSWPASAGEPANRKLASDESAGNACAALCGLPVPEIGGVAFTRQSRSQDN
jgi:hypothetical protein